MGDGRRAPEGAGTPAGVELAPPRGSRAPVGSAPRCASWSARPPTNTDDGLRAALEIRAGLPGTAVLVLSQYVHERYALELLGDDPAGVGYLLKQRVADLDRFFESLRRVCAGGTAVDPEVVSSMLGPRRDDPLARLTDRQREVLALMAEGRSNAGIARQLVVTEKAVAKHITRIFDLLELDPAADDHRRVLAVVRYLSASAPT